MFALAEGGVQIKSIGICTILLAGAVQAQVPYFDGIQTDWSGGPGVEDQWAGWYYDTGWDSTFLASYQTSWSGQPGELTLQPLPVTLLSDSTIADDDRYYLLETADIDGTGADDLVGMSWWPSPGEIRWWGDASVEPGHQWESHLVATFTSPTYSGMCTADIDADGSTDILAAWGVLVCLVNDGSGDEWTEVEIAPAGLGLMRVCQGDPDGDGDIDAVAASQSGAVYVFESSGGSQPDWTQHLVASGYSYPSHIEFSDVDCDGDQDLFIRSGTLAWLENPGSFSEWPEHLIGDGYSSYDSRCAAADVDCDQDPDFISYHTDLWWWENLGAGQSWQAHCIDPGTCILSAVVDFDFDNDPDLLAGMDGTGLCLLENGDGQGTAWIEHCLWLPGIYGYGAAIGDFDGGGIPEVAAVLDPQPSGSDTASLAWIPLLGYPTAGSLESSILHLPVPTDDGPVDWGAITWSAETPPGTILYFRVRNNPSYEWSDPIFYSGTDLTPLLDYWPAEMQYKAEFLSSDPLASPVLHEVDMEWYTAGGIQQQGEAPEQLFLAGPSPNPTAGEVHAQFGVPAPGPVSIMVFDLSGRVVLCERMQLAAGVYSWSGFIEGPGVYFLLLEAGYGRAAQRLAVCEP
jgi:hypothetical protein